MDGSAKDGELTLHMEDYQDVLRVETTGWNESIHLVDVVVEGDVYDLQVSILNMDQEHGMYWMKSMQHTRWTK